MDLVMDDGLLFDFVGIEVGILVLFFDFVVPQLF